MCVYWSMHAVAKHSWRAVRWQQWLALLGSGVLILVALGWMRMRSETQLQVVRRDLRQIARQLDRRLRQAEWSDRAGLDGIVEGLQQRNAERIAWIVLRDARGQTVAVAGEPGKATFSAQTASALRPGRSLFVKSGDEGVELFPVGWTQKRLQPASLGMPEGTMEIAVYLETATPRPRKPVRLLYAMRVD